MQRFSSIALIAILSFSPVGLIASTNAATVNGKITTIYPDPDDFVIELNVAGPCGSRFFTRSELT